MTKKSFIHRLGRNVATQMKAVPMPLGYNFVEFWQHEYRSLVNTKALMHSLG